ncbi:bar-1 [Pristionchus pacificus]|uniref:Beta-catenin/armadillo-related protein 1 n=1 Tax=Pristionchus pacificus TaxID=54126 RepID=A0A2A6D026_PRIPA|nr:bar-1 [Pristionchus pacificus]|eukprot:PDM83667.1 bar-1 [Pristionchus pacificus]
MHREEERGGGGGREGGRLLDLDGTHQGNTLPTIQPLPPLETIAHGSSPSLPPMDPAGFKINRWQNRNFDSGVQTMVHSQTQSLMSIHPSEISVMSGMTEDVTRQDLTDAQRCRFERLSITPSGNYEQSGLPELVQLMKDDDEAVVYKAVYMMQNIAKMDADHPRDRIICGAYVAAALREVLERRSHSNNIVRVALGTLFYLCNHPDGVRDVVELVGNEPSLLTHLIKHMRTASFSSYKYAILSLHSILSDRSALGQAATAEARRRDAISPAVEVLRPDQSEKLLPIIVDLIRILCEKSHDQKNRFVELGGVARLLEILQRCNYENLLWRTTKLLVQIANFSPSSLMTCSAPSILHTRLSHGSLRLVLCLLECLRALSDVASPVGTDATPILSSILCLFGSSDPYVSLYCVQILSNMIANHRTNKEFLASKGVVPTLMRVLYDSTLWVNTDKDREVSEEMQECLLCCLLHLCKGHEYAQQVCSHVMADGNSRLLLDRLYNMRPAVLRQTLLILVQTSPLDVNLPSFRSTQLQTKEDIPLTFVHQVVIILRVAFHQFPSAQQGIPLKVENVKVVELIVSTLSILASLCRDRRLLEETIYHFLQPLNSCIGDRRVFLPLFALEQPFIQDDSMTGPALNLLLMLISPPCNQHVSSILSTTQWLYQVLQTHARRPEQQIANPANSLLSILYNHSAISHDRLLPQYDNYQQYGASTSYGGYPMASSYPPPSHHSHPHQHLPPPHPIVHSSMVVPSSSHSSSSSRPQPSPEGTPAHNLSGRSDGTMENIGPWPEDLQPLEGDPFAQVFCSPSTPPSPAPPAVFDAYAPPLPPPNNQYPYPDPYHPHDNY